jgi:superfamily II DNA or RNA helicase
VGSYSGNSAKQTPILQPYQRPDLDLIRDKYRTGSKRVLYQGPTTMGKTVIFSHVVAGATEDFVWLVFEQGHKGAPTLHWLCRGQQRDRR